MLVFRPARLSISRSRRGSGASKASLSMARKGVGSSGLAWTLARTCMWVSLLVDSSATPTCFPGVFRALSYEDGRARINRNENV